MKDNFLLYAVIVSLAVHAGCLTYFLFTHRGTQFWKARPAMAYNIVRPAKAPAPSVQSFNDVNPDLLERIVEPVEIPSHIAAAGMPVPSADLESFLRGSSGMDDIKVPERKPEPLKGVKLSREVVIPMLKSDKMNSPAYIGFNEIARSRIREAVLANYSGRAKGDVYVTFIVMKNGSLGQVQVIDDRSQANDFLKEIALRSIRQAAPFPPFPADLNYPELTFNVSISFQYREE